MLFDKLAYLPRYKGIVLMYHRIGIGPLSVTTKNFEKQVNYLKKRKYNFLSLNEFIDIYNEKRDFKKKVLLTFDDGHLDNYINAFPILKKYKIPAVIFLNTGFIGAKLNWTDSFWYNDAPPVDNRIVFEFMNWDQIKEMNYHNIEFQPHTHTHANTNLLSEDEIRNEIQICIKMINSSLNNKISSFAYPYGIYDERLIKIIKEFNIDYGFSIENGESIDAATDPYKIPRKACDNISQLRFRILISKFEPVYQLLRNILKRK